MKNHCEVDRPFFSTAVRQSHDYSYMVLAPDGRSVAKAAGLILSFIRKSPMLVRAFIKRYPPETLWPGDTIILQLPCDGFDPPKLIRAESCEADLADGLV